MSGASSPKLTETAANKRSSGSVRLLRCHGLRPTWQRIRLADLLFVEGGRHVTAEMLYAEACAERPVMSLATIYNTLRHFTGVGLLRQIGVYGSKVFFDTNPSEHHHFYDHEERLFDTPGPVTLRTLPTPPPGYEIAGIDVLVALRPRESDARRRNRDSAPCRLSDNP